MSDCMTNCSHPFVISEENIHIHPNYSEPRVKVVKNGTRSQNITTGSFHDLALLKLDRDINSTSEKSICLPPENHKEQADEYGLTAGFGYYGTKNKSQGGLPLRIGPKLISTNKTYSMLVYTQAAPTGMCKVCWTAFLNHQN